MRIATASMLSRMTCLQRSVHSRHKPRVSHSILPPQRTRLFCSSIHVSVASHVNFLALTAIFTFGPPAWLGTANLKQELRSSQKLDRARIFLSYRLVDHERMSQCHTAALDDEGVELDCVITMCFFCPFLQSIERYSHFSTNFSNLSSSIPDHFMHLSAGDSHFHLSSEPNTNRPACSRGICNRSGFPMSNHTMSPFSLCQASCSQAWPSYAQTSYTKLVPSSFIGSELILHRKGAFPVYKQKSKYVKKAAAPISMSLQLQEGSTKPVSLHLDSPSIVSLSIPAEFFADCFDSDYKSEAAAWPEDLATTTDYHKIEQFLTSAHSLARRWLPGHIVTRLENFIHDPKQPPVLVIRGLPIDKDLPPTGADGPSQKVGKLMSETWLAGVSRIVGQPFTFDHLRGGRSGMGLLVHELFTTPDKLQEVSAEGSQMLLEPHCDFFQVLPEVFPTVISFIGLRGDPAKVARTTVCDFKHLYAALDPADIKVLREERITWQTSPPWQPFSKHIIEGSEMDPKFNLFLEDLVRLPGFDAMVHGAPEAVSAYKRVKEVAKEVSERQDGVWLDGGDLMLFNQNRAAHGRSPFAPKFDGNDRWLQRTYINEGAFWQPRGLVPWPVRSLQPISAKE